MTKRIGLIINPTSAKGRGAAIGAEVAAWLEAEGHEVIDLSDETAASTRDRANTWVWPRGRMRYDLANAQVDAPLAALARACCSDFATRPMPGALLNRPEP